MRTNEILSRRAFQSLAPQQVLQDDLKTSRRLHAADRLQVPVTPLGASGSGELFRVARAPFKEQILYVR